jgi:hypothetical protein
LKKQICGEEAEKVVMQTMTGLVGNLPIVDLEDAK